MTRPGPSGSSPLVAVLGASGYVGSAVTAALARRPIRLRAVARRPSSVPEGVPAEIEARRADLTDPGAVGEAVAGADAVVHLVTNSTGWRGADADPTSEAVNVGVMEDLLRALRARRRTEPGPVVVFAGSTSQVGLPPRLPIDGGEPDRPATSYDRQKLSAEHALKAATAEGAVCGVSLRLPTVFGPNPVADVNARGVVATMARRALAGEPLTMWDDGALERDLLQVNDVGDAFLAALDHAGALAGRHWLLGTGRGAPLGDVFRTIAELVSVQTGRPPVPVVSVPPPDHATPTDRRSVVIDSSAFRAVTGWHPQVPLRSALSRTVAALVAATGTTADPAATRGRA